jgi:hypothetical protein
LICLLIFGEEYQLSSSSLYNFLHSPVTSYLFGPILSLEPCSQTPSDTSFFNRDQVLHPYKKLSKLWFCMF